MKATRIDPDTYEYLGLKITKDYESRSGNGRRCGTVQGWRIQIQRSYDMSRSQWEPSLQAAVAEIDRWRRIWQEGRFNLERHYSVGPALVHLWGTMPEKGKEMEE